MIAISVATASATHSFSFLNYLNVILVKNEIQIDKLKYDAYNTSIKSLKSLFTGLLYKAIDFFYDSLNILNRRKTNLLEKIRYNKVEIFKIAIEFYANRESRLTEMDFIYFSIITATSTVYGDILPNNSTIRTLVSVEIILSLFLLGFFFYSLSQRETTVKKE